MGSETAVLKSIQRFRNVVGAIEPAGNGNGPRVGEQRSKYPCFKWPLVSQSRVAKMEAGDGSVPALRPTAAQLVDQKLLEHCTCLDLTRNVLTVLAWAQAGFGLFSDL